MGLSVGQHQHGVHRRYVHSLVEQVHGEDHAHAPCGEVGERCSALLFGGVRPDCRGGDAGLAKHARHESRVLNADAESERSHPGGAVHPLRELLEHEPRPDVVCGEQIRELLHVVTLPSPPWNVSEIESVMDSVVRERGKPVLVYRVP